MLNQEVHKNLRRNKTGIHVDRIEKLSPSYKRPPGFTLLPTLLNASMQNKSLDKNVRRHNHIESVSKSQNKFTAAAAGVVAASSMAGVASKLAPKSVTPSNRSPSKNEMLRLVVNVHEYKLQATLRNRKKFIAN